MEELTIKFESRTVKAKVRKIKHRFRLPRKVKKKLNKAFGPSAYVSWHKKQVDGLFKMTSVEFASPRKLNVNVTQEMLDDLMAYDPIDAEQELEMFLRSEML